MKLVNAWIFLDEDEPKGTNYNDSQSCYQRLIKQNIYQSVDILYICFVTTTPTSTTTIPSGDGSSYTIEIRTASHPGGLTNQDYMNNVIRDARKNNPNIKIAVTLDWGDGSLLSRIFPDPAHPDPQSANNFAANLVAYFNHYNLDGFDIDWESPISEQTTKNQFALLVNAIGAQFRQQKDKHYYLTLSPAEVGNLDATAVNNSIDFINLQLYSRFTCPDDFKKAGVNPDLFAYGAKFESDYQTAQQAYQDNEAKYHYPIFTCWRLNSGNYEFEQTQQQQLYQLVFPNTAQFTIDIPAGPIWNDDDAKKKCPIVCAAHMGKWNGQWRTVVEGKMSVCGCIITIDGGTSEFTIDVLAGPIWSDDDAKEKCPIVCASYGGEWNGQWRTVVEGKMSVCGCKFKV